MLHILPGRSSGKLFFSCGTYHFSPLSVACVNFFTACWAGWFFLFLLYCSHEHLDTGERILHSGVQGLGWCLWTCDNMIYIFHSDTLSCSFWGVMDHSRQSPHFKYADRRACSWKNRRGCNFIIGSSS